MYDFNIIYQTRKSSCCPKVQGGNEKESTPNEDEEEWMAASYKVEGEGGCFYSAKFSHTISKLVGSTKIEKKLKD